MMTGGKIARIWEEGYNSMLKSDSSVVLVLTERNEDTSFQFCYVRLLMQSKLLRVGDKISWKGKTVYWKSKSINETVEIERFGKTFTEYNTRESPMVSEWRVD